MELSKMKEELHILVIEPDTEMEKSLVGVLETSGYGSISKAPPDSNVREFVALVPELVVLGPSVDQRTLIECIHKLKIMDIRVPILIVVSKSRQLDKTTTANFEGIYKVTANTDPNEINETIEIAIREKETSGSRPNQPVLIGQSREISTIKEMIHRVADKDITVLITGESGTGKELIARSIHGLSSRNQGPLVKINCGALPDDLLESEMFGFQKGAFTGAHKDKPGRFETADGGTLFIDEIGDLNLSLQVKFLQVLEEKVLSRLGGVSDKAIDVRVVAATNADLGKKVRDGTFRKDLFYRLNVSHIEAVPLRERKEDIPLLIHYYLNKYCFDFKREMVELPDTIMSYFMDYHWPGNVRELENVLRRAIVLGDWNFVFSELIIQERRQHSNVLSLTQPEEITDFMPWSEEIVEGFFNKDDFSLKNITKAYVSQAEGETILKALKATHWNRKRAAQLLQISYKTLLNRIDEYSLRP